MQSHEKYKNFVTSQKLSDYVKSRSTKMWSVFLVLFT